MSLISDTQLSFKGNTFKEKLESSISIHDLKVIMSERFGIDKEHLQLKVGLTILQPDNRLVSDFLLNSQSVVEVNDTCNAKRIVFKVNFKDETGQIKKKRILYSNYDQFLASIRSSFFPNDINASFKILDYDGYEFDAETLELFDPNGTISLLKNDHSSSSSAPQQEIEVVLQDFCAELKRNSIWIEPHETLQKIKDKIHESCEDEPESVILFTKDCPIPDTNDNMKRLKIFSSFFFKFKFNCSNSLILAFFRKLGLLGDLPSFNSTIHQNKQAKQSKRQKFLSWRMFSCRCQSLSVWNAANRSRNESLCMLFENILAPHQKT